jgi:DNA polymerase III subunit delta'
MADLTEAESDIAAPALPWPPLLPWQIEAAHMMLSARASWPPALLIHGRRGIGKHALALNLAQALLCESPQEGGLACGRCASCRYAVAGQHPDLLRLELSEFDSDEGEFVAVDTIAIARVRMLIDFAQITSHRQRAKVAVIAPAERMNPQAANALLKTLEEPPPGTYLILAADQAGRLPATIRSRCRQLQAPAPDSGTARAWLAAQKIADPAGVLAQAGGAPLVALELAVPALQTERRAWLSALGEPRGFAVTALAARVEAGTREERLARLARAIEWLLAWTADLARVAAGSVARQNSDFAPEIDALAHRVAPLALFRYHDRLLQQRALLVHPLQPRLVAEAALIDYQALFR